MKPACPSTKQLTSERGAALLAALCLAAVLAISLASYVAVCYRSLQMSTRNVNSTRGVELAEVGMEEALWALNKNDWSGWTISGTTATKTVTGFTYDNGATGAVTATVTNYDGSGAGSRTVTVTGTTTLNDGTSTSRTLTSSSSQMPLFVNAVAGTTGKVKFKVAGTVDSYNSSLGDYSTQTPTYSAILSSGSTSTTSAGVQLTNAQVKGYAALLNQSAGSFNSTSATLHGPTTPGATKIDDDRISTSPYQPLFEEKVPTGASTLLPSGTATIGTAGASTPTLYTATIVALAGSDILTVDGPVTLVVSGDLTIANSAKIVITANGSLDIHLGGDLSIKGNGIQNDTKLPRKLALIAKADNVYDALEMTNTTPFYGVIYTPYNSITIGSAQTIYGAIVAKSVTFNVSPVIHYDLDLRDSTRGVFAGLITPYAVADWRETASP